MPVSAVSFYRGGTVDAVVPLARRMQAILRRYGLGYQVSRALTPQDDAGWMVVVQYADEAAQARALEAFRHDPEHRQVVAEISQVVTFIKRDLFIDIAL